MADASRWTPASLVTSGTPWTEQEPALQMSLVVILDDRVTNRNIFTKLAASIEDGLEVRAFAEPADALNFVASNTPDIVVTDYKMPGMNGAEFTRRFRALPDCDDVPVVVITVYEDRAFRLGALEAGATDFLQSPVDHHEFVTRARNLLRLRRQQEIIKSRATSLERELIDAERSRDQALRDSRERLAQVIDTVPAMISAADRKGECVFVNAYQAGLAGMEAAELVGSNATSMFGEDYGARGRALDRMVFTTGKALPPYEEEVVDAEGARRVFLTTKSPLRDGVGRVVNVLTTALDITDRKRAESHLVHLAHHDVVTDLPNRTLLADRLRREIARARRGDRHFALHFLDLDRFKSINDVLGHHVGDKLLKAVAGRLAGAVREVDTVARLGGDEFAILQTDIADIADAEELARRLTVLLDEPFIIDGNEISSTASVGVTLHPRDGADVDELLKNADLAMYRAKADGGGTHRLFSEQMDRAARDAVVLQSDLRRALMREEFVLHYQPQIDLATGRIVGAEALLRWQRPGAGLVGPGDFLPLAEENGFIVPLNAWVLEEACRQAAHWRKTGLPPLRMAVNLSPIQFRKQDVATLVAEILERTGLEPNRLELELTETIVLNDTEATVATLRRLQALGVSLSIDDFGTGYSSLAYVKSFPVNRLKIDQCFVRNLLDDPSDAAIVRAIVNLGHSLGLKVIAEGVERPEQAEHLRAEGCDEVQGYYFGKPVPAGDFTALFRQDAALARAG